MNFFNDTVRNIKTKPGFIGNFLIIGFLILIVVGIIFVVQYLVSNIWCIRLNHYEHFEDTNESQTDQIVQSKTAQLQTLQDMIESDLELLDDSADAVCDITKTLEDNYISNNAAPTSSDEYSLPADEQKKRQAKREKRAKARFEDDKSRYAAIKNIAPLYECFDSGNEDAEKELRDKISEIERIMDTAQMKAAATKGLALESLMSFNSKYLNQASVLTEGFDELSGQALLDKADALIQKGNDLHQEVLAISSAVKKQQSQASAIFKKTNDIKNGNITANDAQKATISITGVG